MTRRNAVLTAAAVAALALTAGCAAATAGRAQPAPSIDEPAAAVMAGSGTPSSSTVAPPSVMESSRGESSSRESSTAPGDARSQAAHPVVDGNRFVDSATGEAWVPRGVNYPSFGYACAQNWGFSYDEANGLSEAATADAIASWGANSVRLPLNQDCWTATNGAAADYSGAKYIDAVKDFAQQLNDAGLVVLLDLHATKAPGDPDSGAEMRAMPDAGAVQFWESVAATFADNPAVMFDAYNEPYGIWNDTTGGWQFELSWQCWRDGGCDVPVEEADAASFSGDTYPAVGMTQLVETIRGAGAQQPIMLGGLNWANDLDGWLDHRPDDDQLAASLHAYAGQECAGPPCWSTVVAEVAAQVPVVVGEFGSTSGDDQADAAYLESLMDWADGAGAGAGYLIWAWWVDDDPDADYVLLADTDGTPAAPVGTTFHDHLAAIG